MIRRAICSITLLTCCLCLGCVSDSTRGNLPVDEELSPDKLKQAADSYVQVAIEYMRKGDYEKAHKRLDRSLQLNPDSYTAYMVKALIHDALGESKKAQKHFQQAVKLAPDNNDVLNNYGQFLCREKRLADAKRTLLKSINNPLNKKPGLALTNLGKCLYEQEQIDEAYDYLLQALQANGNVPLTLLYMSRVLYKKDNLAAARDYLQRYEKQSGHSPSSLWLGLTIERDLGNREAMLWYRQLLLEKFPDTSEAHQAREQ